MVFPGMRPLVHQEIAPFLLTNRYARELVATADDVLGHSILDGLRESDDDYSHDAQVVFLTASVAAARWAEAELGVKPEFCVGASFGAKAAAAYTGTVSFPAAVKMTVRLAECMDEYFATEHTDIVTRSFVRVPQDQLDEILGELDARGEPHDLACRLDDDFFMLNLRERDLDRLDARLRAVGGMPLYTMRPPLHSPAFAGLRAKAERVVLHDVPFADPSVPVVSDHDGTLIHTGEGIRALLLDGIVRPLLWPVAIDALGRAGVTAVCVAGPDRLFGRVGATTRAFEVIAATPERAMRPRRRVSATTSK